MTVLERLILPPAPDHDTWRPELLDPTRPEDRDRLVEIQRLDPGLLVFDEIVDQVRGLLETRDPAGTLDSAALAAQTYARLGDDPQQYGIWAYYAWSRRLVHVLPEDEFRELRTSRNRNKITAAEQDRLRALHIGIVGLSIGQAAAVTLTLEEVGGLLVLADFDHLELSNLNRLRAGVQDLGVNKAILAAREVYEITPYARVEVWTEGVNSDNVDAFLTAGGRPLDMVYEECDDLFAKFLVRQHARKHRIPVLMETSDRGVMDVERFDLEPERPLFHGLVGAVEADELRDMTTIDKVPLVMKIIGRVGMSDRMAASMVDIESTLKSWPQLASEVALGAGLNVDTARRIALGELTASGRFYVDMHEHIHDGTGQPEQGPSEPDAVEVSAMAEGISVPPLHRVSGSRITVRDVEVLTEWATTAFSGGNCQPWRFTLDGTVLTVRHLTERSASFLDVDDRGSHLGFGSLLENVAIVAPAMGIRPAVTLFPDPTDLTHVADIRLTPGDAGEVDPLVSAVPHRITNRRLGKREPLDPDHLRAMDGAFDDPEVGLQWITDDARLAEVGAILGAVDRVRLLDRTMHQEMMGEIRWSLDDVEATRDGLDVATLELSAPDLAAMRMVRSWPVMRTVGQVGGGAGLERPSRKAVRACSAVGLMTVRGTDPESFVRAGRAIQRVWLAATAQELAFQPMTSATYLFHRMLHLDAEGMAGKMQATLRKLRERYEAIFDVPRGHAEPMLFRIAHAEPATARSLRLPLSSVLTVRRAP